jgi:membrane protease subunit HflC
MAGRIATALFIVVLLLAVTLFAVGENERVLRLRGNTIVEQALAPGLHARVPLLDRVVRIDALGYATRASGIDVTSSDGQTASVDADIHWRVVDAASFVTALDASESAADRRLAGDVGAAVRTVCATRTLQEIIGGGDAAPLRSAVASVNARVRELGIEVSALGLLRIDLKDAAAELVQRRMQQGFQAQLAEERGRAGAEALQLRAAADEQGAAAVAAGQRDAQRLRGEGEAQAAAIYARAWGASPEFAAFYRSLQAYRAVLGREGDVMVLTPDGDFFKYLHNPARH